MKERFASFLVANNRIILIIVLATFRRLTISACLDRWIIRQKS